MTSSQNTDSESGDGLALAMRLVVTACSDTRLDAEDTSTDHRDRFAAGKIYGGITAQDNGRLHAGDVYNIYNHPEPSAADSSSQNAENKLRRMRAALAFPQMGGRAAIVEDALSDTCQWLFSTPEYKSWCNPASYDEHHGFLWIRGKPGAGKSTAMKTLLNRARSGQTKERALSFFFNARGEALERSTEGLYRSLLHQATASMSTLPSETTYGLDSVSLEAYKIDGWQVGLLKSLIKKIVLQLNRKCHWSCYIDALDEGDDEDDVRDMVEYLEELTETAHEQGLYLSVCLASRHYPNISVRCLEKLNLDDHTGHFRDIETYVREKIANRNTTIPEDVVAEIKARATGVFLWVVLVAAEIKKYADYGNHHQLRSLLDSIPDGVEKLLDKIVRKAGLDRRVVTGLQWASFALRLLTPKEFYTAVMLGIGALKRDSVEWDNQVDAVVIQNFILSASRGLLEIVTLDDDLRISLRVQFIHESVREYFLHGGLQKVDPTLLQPIGGICHERLTRWCSEYFDLTDCSNLVKRLRPNTDLYEWWRLVSKKRPLLRYALDGALRHADHAAFYGSTQMPFGTNAPFEDWLKVKSCITVGAYPDHASRLPGGLLCILIYERCYNLVKVELSGVPRGLPMDVSAHFNATDLLYERDTELLVAESKDRVNRPANKIAARCLGGAIHVAVSRGAVRIAIVLIQNGANPNDHCQVVGSPLSIALRLPSDRVEMVTMLVDRGARLKEDCTNQCLHHDFRFPDPPLYDCVPKGELELVELLLKSSANPDAKDNRQCTPLWMAIKRCDLDAVQLLLEYGADVNATFPECDVLGCNILSTAVHQNVWYRSEHDDDHNAMSLEITDLLLEHGAIDVRCERCNKTALDHARSSGDESLVHLLQDANPRV
jgi:hypothetical protein